MAGKILVWFYIHTVIKLLCHFPINDFCHIKVQQISILKMAFKNIIYYQTMLELSFQLNNKALQSTIIGQLNKI